MTRPMAGPATDGYGPTLRWRLLAAMALIVVAGAGTLFLVAFLIAPSVFYAHLADAGVTPTGEIADHVNTGFATALLAGIAGGVAVASLVAVAVAVLVARRITDPLVGLADAASLLSAGDYAARVEVPRMGPELAELADAVNSLAARLEATADARLRLLHDLRHELRTPLASLEATVEAIADGILPADHDTLVTLTDQARRLSRLVDDLDGVNRADEHAFRIVATAVDLRTVAEATVLAATTRYAGSGVTIAAELDSGPVLAHADRDRVGEILDQLLDNAVKNCREGDRVTVAARVEGRSAILTVDDTGRGFPPDQGEKLFERFYRHDPGPAGGSGVGLTLARTLARDMHGTLTADSPGPGCGARFSLALPRPRGRGDDARARAGWRERG